MNNATPCGCFNITMSTAGSTRVRCLPTSCSGERRWRNEMVMSVGDAVKIWYMKDTDDDRQTIIKEARLPEISASGPIALQHHNDPVQFRNLFIKELK